MGRLLLPLKKISIFVSVLFYFLMQQVLLLEKENCWWLRFGNVLFLKERLYNNLSMPLEGL